LIRFITRLTSSSYSSAVSVVPLSLDRLHRDQFGFQKLVVAITRGGKLFGLDSANGNVVWSKNLGLFGEKAELEIIDMWTVREFGELGNPTLAVLAIRNGKVSTVLVSLLTARRSRSTLMALLGLYLAIQPIQAFQPARNCLMVDLKPLSFCLLKIAGPRTELWVSSTLLPTYTFSHSAKKSLPT
jgi:hypothetical protein